MAKSLSAATKLKIARSLKGNKNAFKGGPKARLSTRQKIANINAATKAKKANLSTDQIARRQAVAKRLRAQARREEALGGGNPAEMKTNVDAMKEALAKSDRLAAGALETQRTAKNADDLRKALSQIKEARAALKEGMPRSARKESAAKTQPRAKQDLNAPQKPAEQRTAALSPAQRRRQQSSRFEANQAKARQAERLLNQQKQRQLQQDASFDIQQKRQSASGVKPDSGDNITAPGKRRSTKTDPIGNKAENRLQGRIDDMKAELSRLEAERGPGTAQTSAERRLVNQLQTARQRLTAMQFERSHRDNPQPPRSDTGSDRSGTFTKKIEVNDGHNTRSQGRKAIETEEDLQDFIAERTPDIIRKLAKGIPQSDLNDLKAIIGKEMGSEGLDALNDILKGR